MDRRNTLRILLGGIIAPATPLATLPLLTGCSTDMPEQAIRAWGGPPPAQTEIRRWALSHALLAPNPHNMQPWLVDLASPDHITLYYDRTRALPHTDPLYRQLIIGCGAFIELLVQALNQRGYAAQVNMFPSGAFADKPDDRPVAVITLAKDETIGRDALFDQVFKRRTHRMPFETDRALSLPLLEALQKASAAPAVQVDGSIDGTRLEALRKIAREAWEVEVQTPRTLLESIQLTRIGEEEINRHRDGISLTGFMPNLAKALGWMTPEKMADPGSAGFKRVLAMGREQAQTAVGWLWWSTAGNTRGDQLQAGRAFVRAHLKATELGLAFHPMSQVLQEYPEMTSVQKRLYETLNIDPATRTVQMLARLGYAKGAVPAPRRELDTLIRS